MRKKMGQRLSIYQLKAILQPDVIGCAADEELKFSRLCDQLELVVIKGQFGPVDGKTDLFCFAGGEL
jgi:hypothetical protein